MERPGLESPYFRRAGITEETVKQRFVPFLKDFYKNRYEPVPGSVEVSLDNVSAEGFVADGRLSFRKPDDTLFVCTYEATSLDKIEEVKYRLNANYFLWDCFAFGMTLAAFGYVLFYQGSRPWLIHLQWTGNLGLLLGMGMIGFFCWYFAMQRWRKYRYIFAIEQFKRYFADEQWVAVAEDVFPAPSDPYWIELRNQCVYHGIGLAVVPETGNVRKINDPTRLSFYGKDRKITHWVTRAQWYQAVASASSPLQKIRQKTPGALVVALNKMARPLHYLLLDPLKKHLGGALHKPLDAGASSYNRFMAAQSVQKIIALAALAVIVPLFWYVISHREENMADIPALKDWRGDKNPEDQAGYLIDGEAVPYDERPRGVPKQYPISVRPAAQAEDDDTPTINLSGDEDSDDDTPTINLSGDEDEMPTRQAAKPKSRPAKTAPKATASTASGCAALQGKKGWIVQDNAFSNRALAEARVAALRKQSLPCTLSAQNCLQAGKTGWFVWLGSVHGSREKAAAAAAGFQKTLQRAGLSNGKPLLRALP
jgi:hypothetical protein